MNHALCVMLLEGGKMKDRKKSLRWTSRKKKTHQKNDGHLQLDTNLFDYMLDFLMNSLSIHAVSLASIIKKTVGGRERTSIGFAQS